jgi:hypothetical protein
MTGDEASGRDPLDLLVEQFLQRRAVEPGLGIEQFAATVPEHADALRELLPAIVALEQHKLERRSSGSGRRTAALPPLERLGDFRIVREIGRGGMGVVFEAVQESLGRRVALKVLPQAALLAGNQLERFRREAQIAAQLHHSNIVPVFGSGESGGYHWYAMQYIAGQSLDRWRHEQAEVPPSGSGAWRNRARFVARLGAAAAGALAYAHAQGTLHRDIKPGNLLLEANDHLWVTDFGLAKALEADGLTHSGDLLGTLQYMAPEQFAGQYDVRSEVYALGVTLYELLALRAAFGDGSRSELMERIRAQRPEPLRRLCPEVPEDLVVVIEKAMARDPADRYRDAAALQADLQAFLDERPIAARRLSRFAMAVRWCRRNRGMAALAASTLLAVLAAGATGWIAFGIARDALGRAKDSAALAAKQSERAEQNLARAEQNVALTLDAFGRIFDRLVGPDPALAVDEDEETGEQTVLLRPPIDPGDLPLLHDMLEFYDRFAAQNAGNQQLQLETARACRRVGAIHARLGTAESLEQAEQAYRQALERMAAISGRDVRRELASLLVEAGRLDQRRRRPAEASARFRAALELLEQLPADGRSVRLERAEVHYLLAAEPILRRPLRPGERPERPPEAERPGEGERERVRAAREHQQRGLAIVDEVLASDPQHVEARALKARCLLLAGRFAGRSGGGRTDADRAAARTEAIGLLRDVVGRHPERAEDRFELSRVLLEPALREDPGRRPREDLAAAIAEAREAVQHAEHLRTAEPGVPEYARLVAQAHAVLGRLLLQAAPGLADAERTQALAEAERELRASLAAQGEDPGAAGPAERLFVLQAAQVRRGLAQVAELQGRREAAVAELQQLFEFLERALAERRAGPWIGEALQTRGPGSSGAPGPDAGRDPLRALLSRLGDARLQERYRALLQRLPGREEGPPAEGRRGR